MRTYYCEAIKRGPACLLQADALTAAELAAQREATLVALGLTAVGPALYPADAGFLDAAAEAAGVAGRAPLAVVCGSGEADGTAAGG